MNYDGVVVNILPAETISTAWWDRQKQTIVLEEDRDTEYKWGIVVDFWGEKTSLLSGLNIWEKVTIWLNSKAREYNGRRYNAITWWKLDRSTGWDASAWAPAAAPSTVATPPNATTAPQGSTDSKAATPAKDAKPAAGTAEYEDELPF